MDKEQLKPLGERLRYLRLSKGLTQAQLANQIGKDQQAIQRLELGRANPSYLFLLEISKGLEIDITELVDLRSISKNEN
jgi:putative transcriptional regulator